MPSSKKSGPSRNVKPATKSTPYSKNTKGAKANPTPTNKKHSAPPSKPHQARNKHLNVNLTSELDSLLGDLNSQLQRKKTKRDARLDSISSNGVSESEKRLNEAQAKHESLQDDMMSALDGISSLGK
ncbi:hypothetical protein BGZ58_002273 [Dissophora ornata]|nr:hypothetical protein BGZ58_002273 [Dissophora ornata]